MWQRLQQGGNPEERIALAEQGLKLESEIREWPLTPVREQARARLWGWLGVAYAHTARSPGGSICDFG